MYVSTFYFGNIISGFGSKATATNKENSITSGAIDGFDPKRSYLKAYADSPEE